MKITKEGSLVRLAATADAHRFTNLVEELGKSPDWPAFTRWMGTPLGGRANSIGADAVAFVNAPGHRYTAGILNHCGSPLPPHVYEALQILAEDADTMAASTYDPLAVHLTTLQEPTARVPRRSWSDLFPVPKPLP